MSCLRAAFAILRLRSCRPIPSRSESCFLVSLLRGSSALMSALLAQLLHVGGDLRVGVGRQFRQVLRLLL